MFSRSRSHNCLPQQTEKEPNVNKFNIRPLKDSHHACRCPLCGRGDGAICHGREYGDLIGCRQLISRPFLNIDDVETYSPEEQEKQRCAVQRRYICRVWSGLLIPHGMGWDWDGHSYHSRALSVFVAFLFGTAKKKRKNFFCRFKNQQNAPFPILAFFFSFLLFSSSSILLIPSPSFTMSTFLFTSESVGEGHPGAYSYPTFTLCHCHRHYQYLMATLSRQLLETSCFFSGSTRYPKRDHQPSQLGPVGKLVGLTGRCLLTVLRADEFHLDTSGLSSALFSTT